MIRSLLDIPPELLVHILAFLPIQALLKFSQTCRYSHSLANSSLHTLSLGIHPTRVSGIISKLGATQYPNPKKSSSAFSLPEPPSSAHSSRQSSRRSSFESDYWSETSLDENDPYKVSMLIPDAQSFDYMTLLSFHTALTKSILVRHGSTLRNLDLSLWTLTTPIAKALSGLSALRALSIRIEDFPHVRAVPRSRVASQRAEQRDAWDILTKTAACAPRLTALRVEGAELSTHQLSTLLQKSRWCRELWLCKCAMISNELWSFLGSEWEGRAALRVLGVMRCGGQLDEETLDSIGRLTGLQFLTLQGCYGVDSEAVWKRNKDSWHIPECIPPLPRLEYEDDAETVIEVDPAYMETAE